MTSKNLKPQHQSTIVGQLLEAKQAVNYHNKNIKPFLSDMENWEAKEYTDVNNDNLNKINNLKNVLIENESIFNPLLSEYELTVTIFIAKYINN